jgi:hypothetical protein
MSSTKITDFLNLEDLNKDQGTEPSEKNPDEIDLDMYDKNKPNSIHDDFIDQLETDDKIMFMVNTLLLFDPEMSFVCKFNIKNQAKILTLIDQKHFTAYFATRIFEIELVDLLPSEKIIKWLESVNLTRYMLNTNYKLIDKFVVKGYVSPAVIIKIFIDNYDPIYGNGIGLSLAMVELFESCLYHLDQCDEDLNPAGIASSSSPRNKWNLYANVKSPTLLKVMCKFYANKAKLSEMQLESQMKQD